MKQLRIACWTSLALVAVGARAGETPAGSQGPSVWYYVCIARPTANAMATYVSPAFADTGKLGQQQLNAAFSKYLTQKYGYPATNGSPACVAGATASAAEAGKKDMLRFAKNVVETGWTPAG